MHKPLLAAALLFAAAGCSAGEDKSAAEQAVAGFHQALDSGRFEALYDGSSADLKRASSKEDFLRLLDAVHRKLGNVQESKQVGWRVNYATGGSVVDLVYETRFAAGKGREEFVYRAGKQPSLLGYNINSSDLIAR
jgi:opacity protein-like surface antigen